MMNYKFKVDGMHCPSCSMIIESELEEMAGVSDITADFKKGEVEITASDDFDIQNAFQKLKDLGYTPKE